MDGRRVADFLAKKVVGIDVQERFSTLPLDLDERARQVLGSTHAYLEQEPCIVESLDDLRPTWLGFCSYVHELFPSASWLRRYNLRWLAGDVVAGITIGLVVVPQALAYASLAHLPPAYGLYTSFTGAALYWMFGTSKDIVIGTTAVGSLLVGHVVERVTAASDAHYGAETTARALTLLAGAVLLLIGLLRLGWVIEFIPYIPISAFITGASITILSTQTPTALGIPGINTREEPYRIIINTLRKLNEIHLDAAIGISAIVLLFAIQKSCAKMEARKPAQKRLWATISSLRLTFAMLLFTLISYIVHHGNTSGETHFRLVGKIERGFQRAGVPQPDAQLVKLILPELPAVAIILVIEHIAIAKAMGRLYNYTVNPSQEIVALGAANLLSPFVGGYVCTGSFGASAVLSKAGVRSPLAGLFSATVLVLALYSLTTVFFFIPRAALAGLIIHAVWNLLTPPKTLHKYWQLSPIELLIWVACVLCAVFKNLEVAIYVGVSLSMALLLLRTARTRGTFLGRVPAQRVSGDDSLEPGGKGRAAFRDIYLPVDASDGTNPNVNVESPYPGVFIYRLNEGYNYTNQAFHMDTLNRRVREHTRRTSVEHFEKESDRLWSDPGPAVGGSNAEDLPYLRAIVLDFAAVNHVDITSVQGLADLKNSLDRYSSPDAVEWHFANIRNRWTRRALAIAGFGFPTGRNPRAFESWQPAFTIAPTLEAKSDVARTDSLNGADTDVDEEKAMESSTPRSEDSTWAANGKPLFSVSGDSRGDNGMTTVTSVDRPFFHVDLEDAVDSAVRDARAKDERLP
ncbi:hypothetical protein HIM_02571 [Hirsutella minnesotensis 3608]|nr:hypothetical protein HIM_02571 [Hirsutella minnesotensis 3608]